MEIRNVSPLGDLDVTLLDRIVAAGEAVEVTDEQALELCVGLVNFEPVEPEAFAAALTALDLPRTRQVALGYAAPDDIEVPDDLEEDAPSTEDPPTDEPPAQPTGRKTKTKTEEV